MALTDKLVAIADAIRAKTGSTEEMTLDQMSQAIAEITAGSSGNAPISGSFTATKTTYTLIHECGFENYLLIVNIAADSIATMKTSTATFNTIFETGIYGSCVNLAVGEYAADMGYRKNIYYYHGTLQTPNHNAIEVKTWTADQAIVAYTVAGCTYHYTIYDLGASA